MKITPALARNEIDGRLIARMILDFHVAFNGLYATDVMASNLCAVGPLQAMIGLAIQNGYLLPGVAPTPPTVNSGDGT